jgi:hypothetical protein
MATEPSSSVTRMSVMRPLAPMNSASLQRSIAAVPTNARPQSST